MTDVLYVRLRCCSNYFSNLGLQPELMSLSPLQFRAPRNLPSTPLKVMHFDDRLKAWVKRAAGRLATVCGLSQIIMVSQLVTRISKCWQQQNYRSVNPVFGSAREVTASALVCCLLSDTEQLKVPQLTSKNSSSSLQTRGGIQNSHQLFSDYFFWTRKEKIFFTVQ